MKRIRAFTLIELIVVIFIVAVLAAIAIPILRGRVDSARWTEGKAMAGVISSAVRAYWGEKGATAAPPANMADLGFSAGDLTGKYFSDTDFSYTVSNMDPLAYTITVTAPAGIISPSQVILNEAGLWTEVP